MSDLPPMRSYFHPGLMLSLQIPIDWQHEQITPQYIRLSGPPHPDYTGSSPALTIARREIAADGIPALEYLIERSEQEMLHNYPSYQLLDEMRLYLSSNLALYVRWFEREDTDQPNIYHTQVQSFILQEPRTLYIINGSTLQPLTELNMPVFNFILNSARVIPA